MLAAFVDLVSEIFPSVDPRTAAHCLRQLSRGDFDPASLFRARVFDFLAQGDVIDLVRFATTDDEGQQLDYIGPGLLISNTCDADHEEHVVFAACFPLDAFLEGGIADEPTIRSNCIFNLLYLPLFGPGARGLVVDLGLLQSHSRTYVSRSLFQRAANKLCSLSEWGFYLLLAKLSIHLMRPEAVEVNRGREEAQAKRGSEPVAP
jgi:hypothetical protein